MEESAQPGANTPQVPAIQGIGLKFLAAAAVILFSIQHLSDNKADVDLWGNVGFVRSLPCEQGFHRVNTFSFTESGHEWVNHEWLSEFVLHHTHRLLGSPGLLGLKVVIGLLLILLLNRAMASDCQSDTIRFFLMLLVVSTMGYGFSTRPHLFTYLLTAILLCMLRRPPGLLLLIATPVMCALWANLHGAFFIALIVLAVHTCFAWGAAMTARRFRSAVLLSTTLALSAAATLLNPYGAGLWKFVLESAAKPRPYLSEWAAFSPGAHSAIHPDFLVLTAVSAISILLSRLRRTPVNVVLLLASLASAFLMRRNIPLFAIAFAFLTTGHVDSIAGKGLSRIANLVPASARALALAVFLPISVYFTLTFQKSDPFAVEVPADRFPVQAVSYMKQVGASGNLLAFFDWAEYCIWHLYPNCRVFLDGRFTDAYSPAVVDEFFSFLAAGKDWPSTLERHRVDMVLLPKNCPVFPELLRHAGWYLAYADDTSGLFRRISAGSAIPPPPVSPQHGLQNTVYFP